MNKNPDRGRSWGDAVAIQWAAKAFKMKINVWDEGSVATPPISACFDYSGDIMYRVIDMAHITMNGMVEHYEPIVPSPIAPAVHTVPHSCPNAKPHTNMKACNTYFTGQTLYAATFSIADCTFYFGQTCAAIQTFYAGHTNYAGCPFSACPL